MVPVPDWSEDAREEFEQRLRRARPYNRAQYLRIKAARELWLRFLDSTEELAQFQQPDALEHLGDSYVTDDPALADHYYRRLLAERPTRSGTTATQHIKLAELLLDRGSANDLDEAAELLIRWAHEADLPFPNAQLPLAASWVPVPPLQGRVRDLPGLKNLDRFRTASPKIDDGARDDAAGPYEDRVVPQSAGKDHPIGSPSW